MAGSSDSLFFADGSQGGGFAAFSDDPFGGPGGSLDYDWGTVTYGINGGVVGCGGQPITRLLGPYSSFAGVHGTASDFTGVAGTSVNHVGVYGQVEDKTIHLPDNFHAGVLGAAQNQPGVIGFSEGNAGVRGFSF